MFDTVFLNTRAAAFGTFSSHSFLSGDAEPLFRSQVTSGPVIMLAVPQA